MPDNSQEEHNSFNEMRTCTEGNSIDGYTESPPASDEVQVPDQVPPTTTERNFVLNCTEISRAQNVSGGPAVHQGGAHIDLTCQDIG